MMTSITKNELTPIVPVPQVEIRIRKGTHEDIDFMDSLQKQHGKALGWFPRKQFEGYVEQHGVLVAESGGQRVGYVLYKDRYGGRDDVGAIYQLAVEPGLQRKCVGAALVKAVFESAAYGCRLFCCWCAQDLPANKFWEGVGVVPIAFRTGSRGRGKKKEPRTHILWQRRVIAGDEHPWWYPFQTKGGAVREERLVFPISPGVHWSEAKPVILPEEARKPKELIEAERLQLEASEAEKKAKRKARVKKVEKVVDPRAGMIQISVAGKTKWIPAPGKATETPGATGSFQCETTVLARPLEESSGTQTKPAPKPLLKHEKAAIAFCRELRDRWQERVSEEPAMLLPGG